MGLHSLHDLKSVYIGKNTMIGPNCIITDSNFHQISPTNERLSNPGDDSDASVYIHDNVWICMNSIILKGFTIGENSIVSAGSVFKDTVPSIVIVSGNPSKIVKRLNWK